MFGLSAVMLALSNFVLGQFPIPRILKPKSPVQNPAPPDPNRQPGGKPIETSPIKGGGDYIDDGYTWFEAVSFQEPVNGNRTDLGWALKSSIRLMGAHPRRSAFKITVSKAGKPLATTRCEGFPEESRFTGISFLLSFDCFKKETAIKDSARWMCKWPLSTATRMRRRPSEITKSRFSKLTALRVRR